MIHRLMTQVFARSFRMLLVLLASLLPLRSQDDVVLLRKRLAPKEGVTILVTDSGLGGLSVVAGIEERARSSRAFKDLRLVFVNAMPTAKKGYNKMGPAEKVSVFNEALVAMTRRFKPDAVLIACNTLSVVYPETPYARSATIPVVGIVGLGVDMIAEALGRAPAAVAMIYGTETTIESDAHRAGLLKRGIPPGRIAPLACSGLAGKIQKDAASEAVKSAIDGFVQTGMAALPLPRPRIIIGLCCTHYGYSSSLFAARTLAAGVPGVEVLNPNDRMSELIFKERPMRTYPATSTSVEVYSRAELTVETLKNIADLVRPASPKTAAALIGFTYDPELWPYPSPVVPK